MQTTNNISFKSNIHFVDRKTLSQIGKATQIFTCAPRDIYAGDKFWTRDVKTCASGGFVSPQKKAVGFHFLHSYDNFVNSKKLATNVLDKIEQPENGLLFGGKSHSDAPYSLKLFKNLKEEFLKSVKNITVFQEHKEYSGQTHMFYSNDKDTWWLCSEFSKSWDEPIKAVKNLQEVLNFYKHISIAKTDKLLINGEEIAKDQAPKIFEK